MDVESRHIDLSPNQSSATKQPEHHFSSKSNESGSARCHGCLANKARSQTQVALPFLANLFEALLAHRKRLVGTLVCAGLLGARS